MSKRSLPILAIVVAAVVAFAVWRRSAPPGHAGRAGGVASAAVAAAPSGSSPAGGTDGRAAPAGAGSAARGEVRRLASDERRRLGEQIAAARERARTTAASAASAAGDPPPPDEHIPVEQVGKPLQDALHDAIGMLARCYEKQLGSGARRDPTELVTAVMTMTSDPDLGTVIDTAQVTDAAGKPLTADLDDCLRDTVDSLALPPAQRGGKINVKYSFRFD